MAKPRVHLICNAHLDPVWQWRWTEGCSEAISTFRNAIEILHDHDGLIFNHNEALLYQWVQKYDPPMFREIQKLVKNGKWFISGGWYLQPDLNLPGTESIIRQIINGKKYFKEYFNSEPLVAYNFDSFGHSAGLPQILKQTGFRMYVFQRPEKELLDLPDNLFLWKGIDGSEIPAYRIETGLYHTERDNIEARLKEGVNKALISDRDVAVFWGLGDHGGGATRIDLDKIKVFVNNEKRVDIIHSTPDNLYENLKDKFKELPIFEGGLQRVFTGCYTSLSRIKRKARECSAKLIQTELLRTLLWWRNGFDFPYNTINELWNDLLFNDFHDILPGTCTETAEFDALNLYGKILEEISRINLETVAYINREINIEDSYIPVSVFNTNQSQDRFPVEFECMFDYRPPWIGEWQLKLFDFNGKEIICQEEQAEALLPFNKWRRKICFIQESLDLGYDFYNLKAMEKSECKHSLIPKVNFSFDKKSGLINTLKNSGENQFLKSLLLEAMVVEDEGDSWGTDLWQYNKIAGKFKSCENINEKIESGPIRKIWESIHRYKSSKIVYHTIQYSGLSFVEFRIRIHWNEERKRLKLNIPVNIKNPEILCEIPGGAFKPPCDGNEYVHGRWIIMTGKINNMDSAIGLINNGQHGFDCIDGEIGLSVLRSAAYCHEQGFKINNNQYRKYMDIGVHDIRLIITVGEPDFIKRKISSIADWLNSPPLVFPHLPFGTLKNRKEKESMDKNLLRFIFIKPGNIKTLSLRPSGKNDSIIIRLHEISGIKTLANIKISGIIDKMELEFKAFEIKTFQVNRSGNVSSLNIC